MSFSLIPDHAFRRITDIDTEFVRAKGITLLLLDLDNTVAPYNVKAPDESFTQWRELMRQNGVELFFVSNSHKPGRVEAFAKTLGTGFITDAGKPAPAAIRRAVSECGRELSQSALIGDQIFTDVLGANLAGISSIIVNPISFSPTSWQNILRRLRYRAEAPFRALCRDRTWRKK